MRIKTLLRINAIVPGVVALVIGAVLWVATNQVYRARADADIADKVQRFNFELNILTQEFLLYGGTRVEKQMRIHHQSMGDLLATLEFEEPEERDLIAAMTRSHLELGAFYDLLLRSSPGARDQLVGVLLVKTQDMRAKTRQFADIQTRQALQLQHYSDLTVMAVIVAMVILSLILLSLLSRRLARGIRQLGDGMLRVSSGDLVYRIELDTSDELGALAQAFNTMTDKLTGSYTSIEKLGVEIERRQKAEMALLQLNADLEQRVKQRTVDLEMSNKELEAFSYSVSHDLRAPLRAVDGFTRKIQQVYGDQLDGEGKRLLQVVRDNAQRMGQLIDDLLAFSRMGRREMALQTIDMAGLVKSVADEICAADPQRTMNITFLPLPNAVGDTAMLRQVWTNLLTNAVKFSSKRECAHIEVGGREEHDALLYWVKDDGAGFDMQYAGKLFGVFQRLHRQDEFEGTGVGLAIAQRIVYRHQGRIWGEGKPDVGATFWFALPIIPPTYPALSKGEIV